MKEKDSGGEPQRRSAVAAASTSEKGEKSAKPPPKRRGGARGNGAGNGDDPEAAAARLAALEAAAVERQARDLEQAKKPLVRLPPSLAAAALRQEAQLRSEDVLRRANLAAPPGFDPVGMGEALKEAFRISDLRDRAATVSLNADIEAAAAFGKAAQALADATAELFKRDLSAGLTVASRLRHLRKTAMPSAAAAAFEFLFRCPEGAIALAEAAKEAVAELDSARQAGAVSPRAAGEPAAAWLYNQRLPDVFTRFLGKKATFGVESATTKRSECVRFIQAAHTAMGREQPTDMNIVQIVRRARKAAST